MSITVNKKAFHDYFIEEKFEAGIALEGWEVKAIRAGRMNIKESYVIIKNGEIFLIGMHISPLAQASTHNHHDPTRTRKLLLHAREIMKLIVNGSAVPYTPVPASVTRGQFKLALLQMDLLDTVEAAIAASDRATQINYAERLDFERHHPLVITMAAALGKTDAEVDALFVLAATL